MAAYDPGIYAIRNCGTGRVYVGQSLRLSARGSAHLSSLRKGNHPNRHLQRAFDKYGQSTFAFEVLERCIEADLTAREQFWCDHFRPSGVYNQRAVVQSNKGWRTEFSPEHKAAISAAKNGVKRPDVAEWMRQRVYSEETRVKMSASAKKRPRKPFSEEARRKMSQAKLGKATRKHTPAESLAKTLRQLGKKHRAPRTAEQRRRMSLARKGKGLGPKSPSHIANLKAACKKRAERELMN